MRRESGNGVGVMEKEQSESFVGCAVKVTLALGKRVVMVSGGWRMEEGKFVAIVEEVVWKVSVVIGGEIVGVIKD